MFKDALGEFGNRAAFCLFYVSEKEWKHMNQIENMIEYWIPGGVEDNNDYYSKLVPKDLSVEVLKSNEVLLLEIEEQESVKKANKIKEMYIKRFKYIDEIKALKDFEKPLFNYVLFLN